LIDVLRKLKKLLPADDKWKVVGLFFLMTFGALLEVIGISVIPAFVAVVADPDRVLEIERLKPFWSTLGITGSGDLLVYGSITLIAVFILKNVYIVYYQYVESRFTWDRYRIIGGNLFRQYMTAPYSFHLNKNTSELLRNVTEEARNLVYNVLKPVLQLLKETVMIISIFVLLFAIEPLITLVIFVLLGGFGGLFLKLIRKKIRNNRFNG
jgi:ATP-binding cassette subfamily C protein